MAACHDRKEVLNSNVFNKSMNKILEYDIISHEISFWGIGDPLKVYQ